MSVIHDPDLADVLISASDDDIGLLIDVITDNGKGRISLSSSVCRQLSAAKNRKITEFERGLVAEELTRFGGNSFMNLFRGGNGVAYKELVTDVAAHVGVPKGEQGDCAKMEMAIISKVLAQSLDRMSEEDRTTFFESLGAFYRPGMGAAEMALLLASLASTNAYRMAAMVASATMRSVIGRGGLIGGAAGLGRGLGVLAGPVGWAIAGLWTAYDLASPAYRVTVPCVLQIGQMRQKMLLTETCPGCGKPVDASSQFCANCGLRLGAWRLT